MARRILGAAAALLSIAVVVFLTAQAIERADQQAKENAHYKQAFTDLRTKYDKLQRDQHELVKLLEDQGKVVPPELGGTVYVPKRPDSNGGRPSERIVERSTRVETKPAPQAPTRTREPAPAPSKAPDPKPVVKVPDIPDTGNKDVDKLKRDVEGTKDKVLKGTPLDGLL